MSGKLDINNYWIYLFKSQILYYDDVSFVSIVFGRKLSLQCHCFIKLDFFLMSQFGDLFIRKTEVFESLQMSGSEIKLMRDLIIVLINFIHQIFLLTFLWFFFLFFINKWTLFRQLGLFTIHINLVLRWRRRAWLFVFYLPEYSRLIIFYG